MASSAPVKSDDVSTVTQRWYVLIIMTLVYAFSIADRYVLSTLIGPISREFNLTDWWTAWLAIPLALFYVLMGIPLSWLCDRKNRRNLLAASVAAWSLMTAITGYTRGFWDLLAARIGVGVGEAGGTPACNSIIADYFPASRRSMAMTIFALGGSIGAWLGSSFAGTVSAEHGWRAAFLVLGIPGIILATIIMVTIKEPKRGQMDAVSDEEAPTLMETMRFLWSQKAAVHAFAGSGLSALWGWGLMFYTPLFMERVHGLDEGASGNILGSIYLWGGAGATLITAYVVARPAFKDPRKIARLLAVFTALATIPSFLAYWTNDLQLAKLMWWLFIPAIYFYIGPAFALCQNLAPSKMRAMAVAITLLIANVLNLIVAPAIIGGLSDIFDATGGGNGESLRIAHLILAPTGFWAAWHYWRVEKYVIEDQKRAVGYV
jgi:predicted MFS family arabinose efflux permease